MPCSVAAIFGAVSAMRCLSSSWPFTTYLSWQGVPTGVGLAQFSAMLVNPMSLPPIVSVTTPVMKSSGVNCGGFGPSGETSWGLVMSSVVAPLHEMSTNFGSPVDGAARLG